MVLCGGGQLEKCPKSITDTPEKVIEMCSLWLFVCEFGSVIINILSLLLRKGRVHYPLRMCLQEYPPPPPPPPHCRLTMFVGRKECVRIKDFGADTPEMAIAAR